MNRALFAAATGMAAQQTNLDVIANNLANADVPGFKGATASFAEIAQPGQPGLGTLSTGTQTVFSAGKLSKSSGPFDVAIEGGGFFKVRDAHGHTAYTRDGSFERTPDGSLSNALGWRLEQISIPRDATSLDVSEDGTVTAQIGGKKRLCGRIRVFAFAAPQRLSALSSNLFAQTPASGKARAIATGGPGEAKVRFGMLEQSNVSIIESMMQILEAQRAYEANAKGVQAADEMMRIGLCS